MKLFRLDASIRVEGSASRALGDVVEAEWRRDDTDAVVTRRHVGTEPVPATVWADAVQGSGLADADRTPEQRAAAALAAADVDAMVEADALLFAVPLYNFGVSQHFKAWVDLIITDPRMGPGSTSAIAGKPVVLATVLGGNYSAGTPREGWDHSTAWMTRILADVWGADLRVVTREFTLVGVNPALDQFTDMAKDLHEAAETAAREHGQFLSSKASV